MSDPKADALKPFVLAMPADFWWTVRVPVPGDNDYTHTALDVLFKPLKQDRLDKMRGVGLAEGEQQPSDEQVARAVLKGWRLKTPEGADVPFNEENLANLLLAPLVRTAIVATYMTVMAGLGARKNG